jgi:hypothetical protein
MANQSDSKGEAVAVEATIVLLKERSHHNNFEVYLSERNHCLPIFQFGQQMDSFKSSEMDKLNALFNIHSGRP